MSFLNKNKVMKKNEILRTIAKLFKEKGYHHTSINDISKTVGLQGGALYYYIKSKEQALVEIGDTAIDDLLYEMEKIGNANLAPKEKLQAMIKTQIDFFVERFYETCVFLIETKALGPKYQRYYIAKRDKYEDIWRKVIGDGMKIGEFRKGDVKLITFAVVGMLNWLVIWFKPNKGWSSEKIAGDLTNLIFEGILKVK
jgi:AcrR family transcriptional regulator